MVYERFRSYVVQLCPNLVLVDESLIRPNVNLNGKVVNQMETREYLLSVCLLKTGTHILIICVRQGCYF